MPAPGLSAREKGSQVGNPRNLKVAEQIRFVVAEMLERRIKDPRLGFVTLTDVRVTGDNREATIFYTVLGDEASRTETAAALERLPDVEKTSIFGTTVHAVLRHAGVDPAVVRAALESQGLPVTAVNPVTPSLEDVFLDVVERREQGERGGQAA